MAYDDQLDRRVALEVGCSLPIKNSPMFDHGNEAPDFVLGRFPLTHKFMNTSANVAQFSEEVLRSSRNAGGCTLDR